jgi:hypothetical protein
MPRCWGAPTPCSPGVRSRSPARLRHRAIDLDDQGFAGVLVDDVGEVQATGSRRSCLNWEVDGTDFAWAALQKNARHSAGLLGAVWGTSGNGLGALFGRSDCVCLINLLSWSKRPVGHTPAPAGVHLRDGPQARRSLTSSSRGGNETAAFR